MEEMEFLCIAVLHRHIAIYEKRKTQDVLDDGMGKITVFNQFLQNGLTDVIALSFKKPGQMVSSK